MPVESEAFGYELVCVWRMHLWVVPADVVPSGVISHEEEQVRQSVYVGLEHMCFHTAQAHVHVHVHCSPGWLHETLHKEDATRARCNFEDAFEFHARFGNKIEDVRQLTIDPHAASHRAS